MAVPRQTDVQFENGVGSEATQMALDRRVTDDEPTPRGFGSSRPGVIPSAKKSIPSAVYSAIGQFGRHFGVT